MEEKKSTLFRKKSLDRISSPEDLDKYIKTASPAVIILVISIALFFIGLFTWGFVGSIEVKSDVGIYFGDVQTTTATVFVNKSDYNKYVSGQNINDMYINFNNETIKIDSFNPVSKKYDSETADEKTKYLCDIAGIKEYEWYYEATCSSPSAFTGSYEGEIVFGTIAPISFLF